MGNQKCPNASDDGRFLRVTEAAEFVGCSAKTIYRRLWDGKLSHFRFGGLILIDRNDLVGSMRRVASREEVLG